MFSRFRRRLKLLSDSRNSKANQARNYCKAKFFPPLNHVFPAVLPEELAG